MNVVNKIEVRDVTKSFAGHAVLDGVSFCARAGEVVALLGDSGAGKSTLLRCLNLLDRPDAGRIRINGFTFDFTLGSKIAKSQLVVLRAKVGMVFQQYHLWAHMTILQNCIEAPCQVLKISKADAIERAKDLLQEMGIPDKQDSYPAQLSGGQQQRAAIVRALMMQPEVMLFDEPTSALDPQRVSSMIKLINTLAEKGMTVVVATHEMKFARELAHKTIFLCNGKILEEGMTQTLFVSPRTEVFQQFIGESS